MKIKFTGYSQLEYVDIHKMDDGLDKLKRGEFNNQKIEIKNAMLDRRGKLLDFLYCSLGNGNGITVNEKVLSILKDHKHDSLEFIKFKFPYKKLIIDNYSYVHFTYMYTKLIDYFKSDYDELTMKEFNNKKPVDYEDYLQRSKTDFARYNNLRLKNTVLKKNFPLEQDIFVLNISNQNIYISERLYKKLKNEKFTGVSFEKANDLVVKGIA